MSATSPGTPTCHGSSCSRRIPWRPGISRSARSRSPRRAITITGGSHALSLICGRMVPSGHLSFRPAAEHSRLEPGHSHSLPPSTGAAAHEETHFSVCRHDVGGGNGRRCDHPGAARQQRRGPARHPGRLQPAHPGDEHDLPGQVPQDLRAAAERCRPARQDPPGGRRLWHRPDAHRRRDRGRAHLQCRRLRPAADLLRQGDLLPDQQAVLRLPGRGYR